MVDAPVLSSTVVHRQGPQDRLLVLLHGYGEPTQELTDRLDLIDPEARFLAVVPVAPFERSGRRIWHRAMVAREEAEEQFRQSMRAVDELLGDLERDHGLPAAEAVVGGFSQGGGLGLALLMGADVRHRPAAGFGVCSFPPHVQGFRVDRVAARGRPYFLSSARQDHFAPIEMSRVGAALLRDTGLDLTYVESEGAHVMTDGAAAQICAWLTALDRGEPRGGAPLLDDVSSGGSYFSDLWEHVT